MCSRTARRRHMRATSTSIGTAARGRSSSVASCCRCSAPRPYWRWWRHAKKRRANRPGAVAKPWNGLVHVLIVVATLTPDAPLPATAVYLQHRLGARRAAAFDIAAACTGFVYGLAVVDGMIRSGTAQRVLLCGAEVLSRVVNWKDRGTCIIFGDGAGAVVVSATEEDRGVRNVFLGADGRHADALCMRIWDATRACFFNLDENGVAHVHPDVLWPQMDGKVVFKHAGKYWFMASDCTGWDPNPARSAVAAGSWAGAARCRSGASNPSLNAV